MIGKYLPIQLAKRYLEEMSFIRYYVNSSGSSIVKPHGGVQTLRNMSRFHEPTWHFDGECVTGQGHNRANSANGKVL